MTASLTQAPGRWIALRVLALAGVLLSAFLIYQKVTGSVTYLRGCGVAGGCANVLGSRWSQWFFIPVAALSLMAYLGVLALSFRPRGLMLTAVGVALCGAPLWFGGLQVWALHQFCPWCLAAHLIGLGCAGLIFSLPPAGSQLRGVFAGFAAVVVLALGQIYGPVPDSHLETSAAPTLADQKEPALPVRERGEGRVVRFANGQSFRLAALPHLGDPAAPHVLVDYFDYACDSCRDTKEDIAAFLEKHPGQLCVVLLPCPINRACNPEIPAESGVKDHAHACKLARLALACWRQDPASFPAVHEALFCRPVLDEAGAKAAVAPLLKTPLPDTALQDPWIDEMLAADFADYKALTQPPNAKPTMLMPKLLLENGRVIHGVTQTREILFDLLQKEFALPKS